MRMRTRLGVCVSGLALLAACGDDGNPPSASGSSSSGAPAVCEAFGSAGVSTGPGAVTGGSSVALLRNVQVQASACVDEVAFLFMSGTPSWRVEYGNTSSPDATELSVRFEHASAVDRSQGTPVVTYDSASPITPTAPSDVVRVQPVGERDGVMTWTIATRDRRPFEVLSRGDQLAVRLMAPSPRVTRCTIASAGAAVEYPSSWSAELSDQWQCQYFSDGPFPIFPNTDSTTWSVSVAVADAPAATVVERMTQDAMNGVVERAATVGGRQATVLDVTLTSDGLFPRGHVFRMYVVATPSNAVIVQGVPTAAGDEANRNRDAVDLIAEALRFV